MNYLVAVFGDRISAEEVYSQLEKNGIPLATVSIVGKGYKSAEELGLQDPKQQARGLARLMSFWLVPFGFAGGVTFSVITGLDTFAWAGSVGNHLVGGLLGAASGAMGSFFVSGGTILSSSKGDALPFRDRLSQGKYLIVVQGSESQTLKASGIVRRLNPENMQSYSDY